MSLKKKILVGIDLGTSNSALAFFSENEKTIDFLETTQLFAPGKTHSQKLLPSVLYRPTKDEIESNAIKLPWSDNKTQSDYVVGSWALKQSPQAPQRVITSSKSWLCNNQVPRKDPILPWESQIKEKLSPVDCAAKYLEHLKKNLESSIEESISIDAIVTVPASFDEVAKQLTLAAAKKAGFANVSLLEEPQAAFYSWIYDHEKDWKEYIKPQDIVLVCDVGGGTTDFSLIYIGENSKGDLSLERIGVGDHLLLGGDNIDHTLAYQIKSKLEAQGHDIDKWQFLSLVHEVREAKEKLLDSNGPQQLRFGFAGKSDSLFSSKNVSATLTKEEVRKTVLEGFFSDTKYQEEPTKSDSFGLHDFGLNYETDPAITKHLASFLKRSAKNFLKSSDLKNKTSNETRKFVEEFGILIPTKIIFNGGIFQSKMLRQRIVDTLEKWSVKSIRVEELKGVQLSLAVAKGATYYNHIVQSKKGLRIRSGTASSYYIGVISGGLAIPGIKPEMNGICVVPEGTEEGSKLESIHKQFGLITGESVEFNFFSSKLRQQDKIGTVVNNAQSNLDESSKLKLTLPPLQNNNSSAVVPVSLQANVTETGTLELSMKHVYSDKKWNLEFNVRAS